MVALGQNPLGHRAATRDHRFVPNRHDGAVPFRWDLVAPDRLGSMLPEGGEVDLWFLPDLLEAAGKVLARSGGGDLVFVGRSLDSMHDLLGAALGRAGAAQAVLRLPFSFRRDRVRTTSGRWVLPDLTPAQRAVARCVLTDVGVTPESLGRRRQPCTFVDVVHVGATFTELFGLLREWVDESRGAWPVIRRKLRFVGVTRRGPTTPHAFRWQQEASWTRTLPAASVVNVSLDPSVWSYFGDDQAKLTDSFSPPHWLAPGSIPARNESTRRALAEAVAVVAHGRSSRGRRAIAHAARHEPTLSEPWLRTLVGQLNR